MLQKWCDVRMTEDIFSDVECLKSKVGCKRDDV